MQIDMFWFSIIILSVINWFVLFIFHVGPEKVKLNKDGDLSFFTALIEVRWHEGIFVDVTCLTVEGLCCLFVCVCVANAIVKCIIC